MFKCNFCYFGQTRRLLLTICIKENKASLNLSSTKPNPNSKHCYNFHHWFDYNIMTILDMELHYKNI